MYDAQTTDFAFQHALQEIDALREKIIELERRSSAVVWRPMSEPPEKDGQYVVGSDRYQAVSVARWQKGRWYFSISSRAMDDEQIQHWRWTRIDPPKIEEVKA